MNQAIKRGARVLVLTLAAALLLACAGCGKKAAQPDEYSCLTHEETVPSSIVRPNWGIKTS